MEAIIIIHRRDYEEAEYLCVKHRDPWACIFALNCTCQQSHEYCECR